MPPASPVHYTQATGRKPSQLLNSPLVWLTLGAVLGALFLSAGGASFGLRGEYAHGCSRLLTSGSAQVALVGAAADNRPCCCRQRTLPVCCASQPLFCAAHAPLKRHVLLLCIGSARLPWMSGQHGEPAPRPGRHAALVQQQQQLAAAKCPKALTFPELRVRFCVICAGLQAGHGCRSTHS